MPLAAPSAARVVAPAWYTAAIKEIGTRELPENRGPAIRRYIELAKCGHEGDPWCALFANACLESTGYHGTRNAMARSFEHDPNFIQLGAPALGCIVTFWRGVKSQGYGHVGFYAGEHGDYIYTLGGNESDCVQVEPLRVHGSHFGLSGYYWPKSAALPVIGKVIPQIASAAGSGKVT